MLWSKMHAWASEKRPCFPRHQRLWTGELCSVSDPVLLLILTAAGIMLLILLVLLVTCVAVWKKRQVTHSRVITQYQCPCFPVLVFCLFTHAFSPSLLMFSFIFSKCWKLRQRTWLREGGGWKSRRCHSRNPWQSPLWGFFPRGAFWRGHLQRRGGSRLCKCNNRMQRAVCGNLWRRCF